MFAMLLAMVMIFSLATTSLATDTQEPGNEDDIPVTDVVEDANDVDDTEAPTQTEDFSDAEDPTPENEKSLDTSNVIEVDTAEELAAAVRNASPDTPTTIRINGDLNLTEEIATNKNIILTSNGTHTITFSSMKEKGIGFNIYGGGSLTIGVPGDDENALTLIMESTEAVRCLINCSNSGSFFVLNSGELKSSAASMTNGVVCLTGGSEFTMNDGKIDGNANARNVWVDSSTFTMNDGEITGGKSDKQGGGAYLTGAGPRFVMNGGSMTYCEATYNGGGVALMSNATFEMNGGTISGCTSNVGGGVYMRAAVNSFTMNSGIITECTAKYGGGGVYMEDTNSFTMNGGTISDCGRVEGNTTISNGGGVYVKGADATFTMNDGEIFECKAPDNNGGGIYAEGATVTVKGTVSGCEAKFGGGVSSTGKLNIEETGVINNCKAEIHGGGVFVGGSEAELTMQGGAITNCTALQGGGIFFHTGKTFTLTAGEISHCTATGNMANGGGVFLHKIETFTMSGGTISNNTAPYLGGGIYMGQEDTPAGSYQITAGEISHNSVTDPYGFGGGIYVQKGITLNLENTLVTGNTASALGGGIWACRTGDIKIYVTDGGAVYDNDAQGADGVKTPDQAGDDIAFVASLGTASTMTLYQKMLGGGFNHYYKDGGITWLEPGADHTAGLGLGAPDGQTSRYGDSYMELCTNTENITGFTALKNVVSHEAKAAAQTAANLIITGNSASRGGGIGTNGNLIIGAPNGKTYSAVVAKEWSDDTPEEKKAAVSVYLKVGEELLGPVILDAANGWTATFTGLTDDPNTVAYAVVEDPIPDSFTPAYQDATISGQTISLNVTNQYREPVPTPETGTLTVSKTVSGNTGETQKEFHFTVTLSDTAITGTYGNMTFTDGVATFTLRHGEYKTAVGLPAGITYQTVEEEANQDGYTTSSTGEAGAIPVDATAAVSFTNFRDSGGSDITYTSVTVKKVWKLDDGGTAADSVTVQLLRNGTVWDTVTLNDSNNWTKSWTGLNDDDTWAVREVDVPEGFTATMEKSGMTFTITNDDIGETPPPEETDPPEETPPPEPSNPPEDSNPPEISTPPDDSNSSNEPILPQTGQRWWPVWVLTVAGAVILAAGIWEKKRYHGKHEA